MGQLCQWHRDTTPLNLGLTDRIHREYYPHCIPRQQFMETRPCGAAKQLKRKGKRMRAKIMTCCSLSCTMLGRSGAMLGPWHNRYQTQKSCALGKVVSAKKTHHNLRMNSLALTSSLPLPESWSTIIVMPGEILAP